MRARTVVGIGTGSVVLVMLFLAAAAAAVGAAFVGGIDTATVPSGLALAQIPADYLLDYQQAAASCPGLPWTVLAGIGEVETDQGRNIHTSSAGAQGPMQFLPATFAEYDQPIPPGGADPASIMDPTDAIYAAARDLCANGARAAKDIPAAIYAYNHADWYVTNVLGFAASYGAPIGATGAAAASAVSYALNQLGTPYRWGGETPGVAFDCSGLTQAAYAAAGIQLPRTAQTQHDLGPLLPAGVPPQPGDLVFFGTPTNVHHVGIVIDSTHMIDAPHAGAAVRIEPFAWADLLAFSRPNNG